MPGYIGLYKYTQQGLANIKSSPERIKQAKALAEKMGCKVVGVWVTMGEYDMVAVGDWPDDQSAAAFALAVASQGNVTTQTMRALSEDEFAQVVGRLP
ncbi:MAG: GYD domain-containing protein [Bacteroidetes bacterium]|nr:GYD domain-containing protein [Bacteroidota bacterium]